ncbi:MAG: NYN domain-containing protein [Candidatus Pacebacteria bacterium]|nr:NYN domain-containing protein [Candidatus Paceibacterota bacterium]
MKTYAFIDASNLFYGGEKSLGWKIDYQRLLEYLKKKYNIKKAFYFGGVDTYNFPFDYLNADSVDIKQLKVYVLNLIEKEKINRNLEKISSLEKSLKRIKFYKKLEEFGYILILKPVKTFKKKDGSSEIKANCDVDMTFYMMNYQNEYDKAVILSGDGDFLPVLKHLQKRGKEIHILARSRRTAKEIRVFAKKSFQDFEYLKESIKQIK